MEIQSNLNEVILIIILIIVYFPLTSPSPSPLSSSLLLSSSPLLLFPSPFSSQSQNGSKTELDGYLFRREKKIWHKRRFVLKDGQFTCYKGGAGKGSSSLDTLLCSVRLPTVAPSTTQGGGGGGGGGGEEFVFEVHNPSQKPWILRASSQVIIIITNDKNKIKT